MISTLVINFTFDIHAESIYLKYNKDAMSTLLIYDGDNIYDDDNIVIKLQRRHSEEMTDST